MKLFEPARIGGLVVRNRLIGAPTVMQYVDDRNTFTPEGVRLYEERAAGGVGMVTVETTSPRADGVIIGEPMPTLEREDQLERMAQVVQVIHRGGARAAIQLVHAGRMSIRPIAPSDVPFYGFSPHVLTTEECEELLEDFVRAARWCKRVGFDCVTYHGAHGWLIQQFLSPYTNHRTDRFGARTFFMTELVRRTKEACGAAFPIVMRISADEKIGPMGITLQWTLREIVPALEGAGVDLIDVSAGTLEPFRMHWFVPPLYQPRGTLLDLAEAVKRVARVPVAGVGRINDPRLAARAVEEGRVDFISISRALLADPEFPRKAAEGRLHDIRKCLACDACAPLKDAARCSINPSLGKPAGWAKGPAARPKRVVVVGGGPGGLQAALTLAQRGHRVHLYEKRNELGGGLLLASRIPRLYTRELFNIVPWLLEQLARHAHVHVTTGREVSAGDVLGEGPDAVVLATGSLPALPEIAGLDARSARPVDDYLEGRLRPGATVAVVGSYYGAEVAASLARDGRVVTLLDENPARMLEDKVLGEIPLLHWIPYMARPRYWLLGTYLKEYGVRLRTGVRVRAIKNERVELDEGEPIPAETVLFAQARKPNRALRDALAGKVAEIHPIGDCLDPRRLLEAIHEGADAGMRI